MKIKFIHNMDQQSLPEQWIIGRTTWPPMLWSSMAGRFWLPVNITVIPFCIYKYSAVLPYISSCHIRFGSRSAHHLKLQYVARQVFTCSLDDWRWSFHSGSYMCTQWHCTTPYHTIPCYRAIAISTKKQWLQGTRSSLTVTSPVYCTIKTNSRSSLSQSVSNVETLVLWWFPRNPSHSIPLNFDVRSLITWNEVVSFLYCNVNPWSWITVRDQDQGALPLLAQMAKESVTLWAVNGSHYLVCLTTSLNIWVGFSHISASCF